MKNWFLGKKENLVWWWKTKTCHHRFIPHRVMVGVGNFKNVDRCVYCGVDKK